MKRLLLIVCIIYHHTSFAQEMWGISNSNFAGSAGMKLNPSAMMIMPYKWEVTILSADISLQNNYVGFARTKIATTTEGTPDPHGGVIDYYTPGDKSANAHIMLQIPSFTFRTGTMAFGFHAGIRHDLSVRNIPGSLAKFGYEGIIYSPLHGSTINMEGIRLGEMTWLESGISVGKQLGKNPEKKWVVGATLKYIMSVQSASLNIESGKLGIVSDTAINLSNFKGELNVAVPEKQSDIFTFPGRGVAVDIGFCYVSNSNHEHFENGKLLPIKKYDYRVGISLIDAGLVSFGGYARTYNFNVPSVKFNATGGRIDSMMTASGGYGSYVMALPAALSVQYDRCLKPKIYLNFSAIQRVPMPMPHIDRPNQLSATLRYETTFFEVAIPYSFYDYYLHRIGFAVRYGIVYMGSDKLGTFINNKEITGVDFYFGLRLTNFDFSKRTRASKKVCAAYSS